MQSVFKKKNGNTTHSVDLRRLFRLDIYKRALGVLFANMTITSHVIVVKPALPVMTLLHSFMKSYVLSVSRNIES